MRDDRVIVLVERAVPAEEIDAAALDARRKQLLAERDTGLTEERLEAIDEELVLLDVQLRIARPGAASRPLTTRRPDPPAAGAGTATASTRSCSPTSAHRAAASASSTSAPASA